MAKTQSKANLQRIIGDINNDIEKGVYKQFPVLKNRLNSISQKLSLASYVINSEPLRQSEVITLIENDYLDSSFRFIDPAQIF